MRERELRLRLRCGPQTGLYFLDFILSFFVIPISAVVAWTTIYYVVEKITDKYWKVTLIVSCALIHSLNHLCCKFIYRFIVEYVTGRKTFFIVSKIYLYVFAFASTVIYGVVPEDHLEQLPYAESPFHNIVLVVISFATLLTIRCRPHIDCFGKDCGGESTPEDVFLFPFRFFNFSVVLTEYIDNRYLYFFCSRLYTETFGIASVGSWFGIWKAIDFFTGSNVYITVTIVIVSYIGLALSKTVRSITSSPFAIIRDKKQGYCDVPTLFQLSNHWKKNKLLYVLDSIFSVFIVGTLVILVWRGAWCLLDQAIYPEEYELSGWISLAIGYLIVFATFVSQSLMKWLIRREDGWRQLVILDIYVVISFCGTVNIWRGIWILLEVHTDLENSLRNCILLHFLSFFILVIFNASNTLLVRGVYIDAGENVEECVEFPCYYFRSRFQEKQKNKVIAQLRDVDFKRRNIDLENEENTINHDQVTKYIDQDMESAPIERIRSSSIDHSKLQSQIEPVLKNTVVTVSERSMSELRIN